MQKSPYKKTSCLWTDQPVADQALWNFLTGSDRRIDQKILWADIAGTAAHVHMLGETGIMDAKDSKLCKDLLVNLYHKSMAGDLKIPDSFEDVHSFLEQLLTDELGMAGERIHAGRSRNDQVLLAVRLFLRRELYRLGVAVTRVFEQLLHHAKTTMNLPMPGYTHMQAAMPSSFGLWFACFAEALADDLLALDYAFTFVNQNPLGTAAGYGSSFGINRELTTTLLGFRELHINPVYAQMSRGKSEKAVAVAISSVATTLSKLVNDVCLYTGQDFGFFRLDEKICTGSSIMPHKRNPDLAELIRGHCNVLQNLPNSINMLTINLPSGYHRDFQLIKAEVLPALDKLCECLDMTEVILGNLQVTDQVSDNDKYRYIYTVEAVNKLVQEGMTFRKSYQLVAQQVREEKFSPPPRQRHSHRGSMDEPDLEGIKNKFFSRLGKIPFQEGREAIDQLMSNQQ